MKRIAFALALLASPASAQSVMCMNLGGGLITCDNGTMVNRYGEFDTYTNGTTSGIGQKFGDMYLYSQTSPAKESGQEDNPLRWTNPTDEWKPWSSTK